MMYPLVRDLAGDGDHYAAYVETKAFQGKSRVDQHRMVFAALQGRVGGLIRGLTVLDALEIIPADEREQLAAFNRTAEAFDIEHDADWCFRAQLVRTPQAIAVVEPSGVACRYAEFDRHPPETVQQMLALLQREGMQTTVSSIHIHGCFGDFNKWQGANWIVRELLGRDLAQELDRWVFVGDSGNDQAMFQHFTHSVGVANIARFVPQLSHLPRYVTQGERGAGFAEVARAILAHR